MQLSQAKKKWIRSLAQKKVRDELRLFTAEGEKVIADIMRGGAPPLYVVGQTGRTHKLTFPRETEIYTCDAKDMEALSAMVTPPGLLAVFAQWDFDVSVLGGDQPRWLLADGIKDPGNMGTLIRTAHWFGVHAVIALNGCAELYNPKTIQSTMGSLGKLPVFYRDAEAFFKEFTGRVPFFGADLEGRELQTFGPQPAFGLIIGSESHGLSEVAAAHVSQKIFIPAADPRNAPESLNAAVSAGIILSRLAGSGNP